MFVLCVFYSKDKRHIEDNQDKEVVQMKYREQKKNFPLGSLKFLINLISFPRVYGLWNRLSL
jgi:hypothetical protein